jgi:hypothetical protein
MVAAEGTGEGAIGIGRRRAEEPRRDGEGAEADRCCEASKAGERCASTGRDWVRERDGEEFRISSLHTRRGKRASVRPTYHFRVGPGGVPPCLDGGPSPSTVYRPCAGGAKISCFRAGCRVANHLAMYKRGRRREGLDTSLPGNCQSPILTAEF